MLDEDVFLMVQVMEAWLVADESFVADASRHGSIVAARKHAGGNVEGIPKADAERLVAERVRSASAEARRLLDRLAR